MARSLLSWRRSGVKIGAASRGALAGACRRSVSVLVQWSARYPRSGLPDGCETLGPLCITLAVMLGLPLFITITVSVLVKCQREGDCKK